MVVKTASVLQRIEQQHRQQMWPKSALKTKLAVNNTSAGEKEDNIKILVLKLSLSRLINYWAAVKILQENILQNVLEIKQNNQRESYRSKRFIIWSLPIEIGFPLFYIHLKII